MSIQLERYTSRDLERWRSVITHPSLVAEFEPLSTAPGALEESDADPYFAQHLRWLARWNGVPIGFGHALVLPGWKEPWGLARIGVLEEFRRRGGGSLLLDAIEGGLRSTLPECRELCLIAWQPHPEASGFAAKRGFEKVRHMWLMERPRGNATELPWPDGITTRTYDGSDRDLEQWNDSYNRSFANNYHSIHSTLEQCRALASRQAFDPTGLLLAFRGAECVGFCRNELMPGRGEVAILGVVPEAQGVGLGRALLRWGVRWIEAMGAERVTLSVDGHNETALSLYRSEGFGIVRTRTIWSRNLG